MFVSCCSALFLSGCAGPDADVDADTASEIGPLTMGSDPTGDELAAAIEFDPGPDATEFPWKTLESSGLSADRRWVGSGLWANRLQDWRNADGRLECTDARGFPRRTVHTLRAHLGTEPAGFEVAVHLGSLTAEDDLPGDAAAGVLLGAGGASLDPRAAALIHDFPGAGGGVFCGIDGAGRLVVQDNTRPWVQDAPVANTAFPRGAEGFELAIRATPVIEGWSLRVETRDARTRVTLDSLEMIWPDDGLNTFVGNLALVSHPGRNREGYEAARFWFTDWRARGARVVDAQVETLGPILSTMHTLSRGSLALTAQLFPIGDNDSDELLLERLDDGLWTEIARAQIERSSYTATFRVDGWPDERDCVVRIRGHLARRDGTTQRYVRRASIPRDPRNEPDFVLAATCCAHHNSHELVGGFGARSTLRRGDWTQGVWFPHTEIVDGLKASEPDLLFFAGDQVYEGNSPTFADFDELELDYLYKWYLWAWTFRDVLSDTPAVVLPDDHDVYQGNLWGAGGRWAPRDTAGGYTQPASFVRLVERTQTSHLPRPIDPTPIEQTIQTHYTELLSGGISFAVLEDRKWKSGCEFANAPHKGGEREDHITSNVDTRRFDLPDMELLGKRQEQFLEEWAGDWSGVEMKLVLSASPFAGLATHHGKDLDFIKGDLDSNGWPQAARRRALRSMRKAFAPHVNGDQHLAILAQQGVEAHRDGPWSFTVPAVANFYPRQWLPDAVGDNRAAGAPAWTGDHLDGLGNFVSVHAAANPTPQGKQPRELYDGMPGFGVVRLDKRTHATTFECWPRGTSPASGTQYPGWPHTVLQLDNFQREANGFIDVTARGVERPVVRLRNGISDELIWALRLTAESARLPLYGRGPFKIEVGTPETDRWLVRDGIQPSREPVSVRADFNAL